MISLSFSLIYALRDLTVLTKKIIYVVAILICRLLKIVIIIYTLIIVPFFIQNMKFINMPFDKYTIFSFDFFIPSVASLFEKKNPISPKKSYFPQFFCESFEPYEFQILPLKSLNLK